MECIGINCVGEWGGVGGGVIQRGHTVGRSGGGTRFFFRDRDNVLCEYRHLPLEVDEEGILMPEANDFYGVEKYVGLMESHGSP